MDAPASSTKRLERACRSMIYKPFLYLQGLCDPQSAAQCDPHMTNATYLTTRNNTYYFKKRIPSDLRCIFNKSHFYTSLKTTKWATALCMSSSLVSQTDLLFSNTRKKMNTMMNEDLTETIYAIMHGDKPKTLNPETNEWISVRLINHPDGTTEQVTEVNHEGQTSEEIAADQRSLEILTIQRSPISSTPHLKEPLHTISDVVDRFIASKIASGTIQAKGLEANKAHLALLIDFFGADTDIRTIRLEQAEEFRNLLLKLPPNRSKNDKLKGKSLREIVDMNLKPQAIATVKGTIQKCSTFFQWATKADYVDQNYFYKMPMPKDKRKESEQRDRWHKEDLIKLFSIPIWSEHQNVKHPYYFWLPLLALYTGARLNELAQLKPNNLKLVDNTLCIHISDEADGQKLKNTSSKRVIPIHKHIIELGFEEYLRQRQGQEWLFDGLLTHNGDLPRDGFSHNASKWFNRLRNQNELSNVDFHGFRHTVADELKQNQVPAQQASSLLGHKEQTITYARYGKDLNIELLKQTVQKLDFKDVLKNVKRWS
ncbi:tyrosine-type recombinase/integrase [Vibrio rotiferianus]|uniref:tyrosine-type recombinase/integrase n=1 Tax=Vibrio rotiferianus TaxID=190895 RepID=UPI00390BF0E3